MPGWYQPFFHSKNCWFWNLLAGHYWWEDNGLPNEISDFSLEVWWCFYWFNILYKRNNLFLPQRILEPRRIGRFCIQWSQVTQQQSTGPKKITLGAHFIVMWVNQKLIKWWSMSEKLAGSAVCDLCLLVTGVVTNSFFQFDICKKIIYLPKRPNK